MANVRISLPCVRRNGRQTTAAGAGGALYLVAHTDLVKGPITKGANASRSRVIVAQSVTPSCAGSKIDSRKKMKELASFRK